MAFPRSNPKLMVIGDSLAQGCRSLSVTAALCSQSWGARIAAQQKWEFVPPNHPWPVLFDLEREIRNLNPVNLSPNNMLMGGFVGGYLQNIKNWQSNGPAADECFDNVAAAGAAVGDLYARSASSSDAEINTILKGSPLNGLDVSHVGDLHLAINARYVLNPSQNPSYDKMSQLDWVEARLPENLMMQIGHNHGLFSVGFSAEVKDPADLEGSITQPGGTFPNYWTQWQTVADRLAALPQDVKSIVILLLPKVGAVGNLMPLSQDRKNGYAPAYDPTLSTHPRLMGDVLGGVDRAIVDVNGRIQKIVNDAATAKGTKGRVTFVSGYDLLDALDYKNSLQPSRRIDVSSDVTVDNRYLNGSLRFGWPPIQEKLAAGGFFSVDGMHPSGVGYAVLASEVMKALKIAHNRKNLLQRAYLQDRLLSDYPAELDMVVGLLSVVRKAINVGHFDHEPSGSLSDQTHFADILRVMKEVFRP